MHPAPAGSTQSIPAFPSKFTMSRRLFPRFKRGGMVLLAGALLGSVYPLVRPDPSARLLKQLTHQTREPGLAGARLSIAAAFRACPTATRADESIPRSVCADEAQVPLRKALRVLRRAEAAARRAPTDPAALHALGLAYVVYGDAEGAQLQQAIAHLQSAARLSAHPAPVLADLAAAHLHRAERTQTPRDIYLALEAGLQALELDPANRTARFNTAMALDRAGLAGEAQREWTRYLEVDSASGWADEARRRVRALSLEARLPTTPDTTATAAELAGFAAAKPRMARDLGWDVFLGRWGAAVLAGDAATAGARLAQAEALGAALERRGGDASLADAVRTVKARSGDPAAPRRLAELHRAFADGRRASAALDYDGAAVLYRRVLADAGAPEALRGWAEVMLGICAIYVPGTGDAVALLRDAASRADSVRHPALAGRARWVLAAALQRKGSYQEAFPFLDRALPLFQRAGEGDHVGAVLMAVGDGRTQLGTNEAAYETLHRAAAALRAYRGTVFRYSLISVLGPAVDADGLHRSAMRVQDEAVTAAGEARSGASAATRFVAEARLVRARLALQAGHRHLPADVDTARALIQKEEGYPRSWLEHDLAETLGLAALQQSSPARADSLLGRAVDFFATRGMPGRLVPALFARAEARLARGDAAAAEADLDRSIAVLDAQRTDFASADLRASLLDASRRVFDRAVMLDVAAGRVEQALDRVERSRASFSPVGHAPEWSRRPLRVPAGQVGLELALVGDTLLAWTVSGADVRLTRTRVHRDSLLQEVEQVRSALELRADDANVRAGLRRLYARLIAPVRARLGSEGAVLVVVADGELAGIPFEALWDGERYLVESHPLRFASTLRDPVRPAVPPGRGPVSLVADPAFDARAFPGLQPLPGAAAEVTTLTRLYPRAGVLAGPRADAAAVREAFRGGGLVHFAGHAVFDDARPERSFLVVAPGRGGGAEGRLTAGEIEDMQLGSLRLVVLSACQTSRGRAGRSGGFAGLAGAFLAAGAGGVVGSLWRVEDRQTRVLMEAFHDAYRASGDGAAALRQAQLRLLRSGEAALRSPAAWAGFRYAGG
jgi:CHAT domain-containing protein